jgi:hypothetical protein
MLQERQLLISHHQPSAQQQQKSGQRSESHDVTRAEKWEYHGIVEGKGGKRMMMASLAVSSDLARPMVSAHTDGRADCFTRFVVAKIGDPQ